MSDSESSYSAAGVNIGAGQEAVRLMRPFAQSTYNNRVLGDIGGFGGLFKLDSYREPILVASTDGVGHQDQHRQAGRGRSRASAQTS